jgi:ATP-dependent helicase/nuclease subunit B
MVRAQNRHLRGTGPAALSTERVSPDLLAAAAAGRTVLAPNTELAAALFDAIERAHRDAGDEIWPTPRVRDFAGWLREQYLQRQLTDSESPRVLSDVEERELWRAVIDTADPGQAFLDPGGASRAARRVRRTLREYNIPLQALADDKSEEVQAFLAWNHAFDQRCRALGCVSADTLLSSLGGPASPVAWIESPQWRPVAYEWLRRYGQVLMPQTTGSPTVSQLAAPSAVAELSAIADWAGTNLAREGFRAWICIPDLNRRRSEVVDALDAVLAPQRFELRSDNGAAPYAVAGGTPLAGYAPVRAALDTFAAGLGLLSFARFSALLRAPQLQSSDSEASAAAQLDVALRRRASSEADLSSWLDLAERVARSEGIAPTVAVQRLRASHQALVDSRGARVLSEWVSVWIAALEAGPWALRGRWSSVEYQAAERFRELLTTLAMADATLGTHSRESAQRILRRAVHDTAFQVQTGVPAIWISGQLMDPWLNYDGLWVSSCSDEQWPPPIAPVALLPVRLQRHYGVISSGAESQLALAADLQNRWQKRASQCIFSYAHPGDGSQATVSPLLPRNAVARLPALTAAPRPHWRALLESAPQLESLWDELAPPVAQNERTRGVATLRAQSRCAFRGFAETRLDAQPLEQPVPGFNERERGELVHHALEHIWSILRDSGSLRALTAEAQHLLLDDAARRALTVVCTRRDPGARWRRRERLRLQNLLGKWLDVERARAPFMVEALEGNTQLARFGGLDFGVRIDRVDRLLDGARVLIDYKTGAAIADWRGERPDNPQLPIYALLLPKSLVAVAYAKVNAAEPGFVAESERREIFNPRSRSSQLEGMPSFAALVGVWSQRVERIAAEFVSGHAEVAPTMNACKTCDLQGLCRVPAALEEPEDPHE